MGIHFSKIAVLAGLFAVTTLAAGAADTTWQLDPAHSDAQFAVTHLMVSTVRGEFHGVTGTVVVNDKDITKSTVNVTIDTRTVDTREPKRDADLKSNSFFDVEKFPTMTFKSTKVEQDANGELKVTGDLTIRGVTKQAVLDVTAPKPAIRDPWGNQRTGFTATTKINRQDFGVSWNEKLDNGGVVVGDNVDITIDVEMIVPSSAK